LIEDGDKYILSRIPQTDVSQNFDYEKRVLTINAALLTGAVNHLYKGEEKEFMLTRLNGMKKSEYEKNLTKYLAFSEENTIRKLTTANLDNHDEELKISYTIDQKSGINLFGKDYYIEMDLRKELGEFTIDTLTRNHDYWLSYKYNMQRETELTLPPNYKVASVPDNLSISNADYEFNISYKVEGEKVLYKKHILFKNPRISKSKFAEWNADIKKLNTAYNETLILKPQS